jgi:hypothetical protein
MSTPEHILLLERIRAEYLEMPGMNLRLEQVARLCGVERSVCKLVLDAPVELRFLCIKTDGAYARVSEETTHRGRQVNGTVESSAVGLLRQRAS